MSYWPLHLSEGPANLSIPDAKPAFIDRRTQLWRNIGTAVRRTFPGFVEVYQIKRLGGGRFTAIVKVAPSGKFHFAAYRINAKGRYECQGTELANEAAILRFSNE